MSLIARNARHGVRADRIGAVILSGRIESGERITADVRERVVTTLQSDRIALDIPANRRVVVSEPICVESGFAVKDLTGQTQVVGKRLTSASYTQLVCRRLNLSGSLRVVKVV
jgi:hypothetical protein